MAYVKDYWVNKEARALKAKEHTKEMQEKYPEEIKESIAQTIIYDFESNLEPRPDTYKVTAVKVEDSDTVLEGLIHAHEAGRLALLNFASYKNPGGMFLEGSKAQEECLCHASFLYNVLDAFRDTYYAWNNEHKNRALYTDRALYTPDVVFSHNDLNFKCDVITCAAPNKSAAQKYQSVSNEENSAILDARIKFVLDVAAANKVDTLILGAYGCGVFGQDAKEVASLFKKHLFTMHKYFREVIFAIPDGKNGNLEAFRQVFG